VGGGGEEVAVSFALLDFFAFFFFFFLAAAEVDGAIAVAVASPPPASGGDGGGVKVWTGSAAVQESVSEVEVIGWKVETEVRGIFPGRFQEIVGQTDLDTGVLAPPPPRRLTHAHHAPHVYSE